MDLQSMPTEILFDINDFLDHSTLLNLAATNKHFRSLISGQKIKASLLCLEKCSLVSRTLLTTKDLYPCYTCLQGRDQVQHFTPLKSDEDCTMAGRDATSRICVTCLTKTRPELIRKWGSQEHEDHVFIECDNRHQRSELYSSGHEIYNAVLANTYWLKCQKCEKVKRYDGSPYGGRRRRYDDAMIMGDMCAACYQPVWDKENEERRLKKNARAKERYREKKEQARKLKEATIKRQQEQQETSNMSLSPMAEPPAARFSGLFMPIPASVQSPDGEFFPEFDETDYDGAKLLFD